MSKKDETAKLNSRIKELEDKVKDFENHWKRALADYQNLEKRVRAEKEEWNKFASIKIIEKLLPLLDTLEKAVEHLKDNGLELLEKQFRDLLKEEGVLEIEALGKTFDPNVHECVDTEEGEEENKIVKVYTKGYKIGDKIIRPAKVKVSKKEKEAL